jgi:hypothetical protein
LEKRLNDSYTIGGSALLLISAAAVSINQKLENFALWNIIRRIFINVQRTMYSRKEIKVPQYHAQSVAMYVENIERMILLSKLYDFKIGIFLQPIMGVDNKQLTPEEKESFNSINDLKVRQHFYADARSALAILKKKYAGQACIEDLSLSFNNSRETIYVDSGHLLVKGNQIIAQNIAAYLTKFNYLK